MRVNPHILPQVHGVRYIINFMPSLQLQLYRPLMRLARWSQGHFPYQDAHAFVRFRQIADLIANLVMRPPGDVQVISDIIGGVTGDWILPRDVPEEPVLLFLHGGGIAFGLNNPIRREIAILAKYCGLLAFGVDYHLIPDYRYPVAHDECFAVYRELMGQGTQVILVGESSGAVLALAVMLRAKVAGLPQPWLCVLISPVVDYGFYDPRFWEIQDDFAHPKFTAEAHKHYTSGIDLAQPDLSPIDANLTGIAPLLTLAGEQEITRGEVDRLVEAAHKYDVPIETIFWPDVWHSWHALAPQLPEATKALKALGKAIRQFVLEQN